MKKRLRIVATVVTLAIVLSFVLSACSVAPETPHDHTFANKWTTSETHHWKDPECSDTDEVKDYAAHSWGTDGICTVCGYKYTPHTHKWDPCWTKDYKYHWHVPLCDDTTELKNKEEHDYVGDICSTCGYNRDFLQLPQTAFKDVGDKFNTVAKPFYGVAETVLKDLVGGGDIALNEERNPRIIGIRYCYGRSFEIIIREDVYISETDEKSEFLQRETFVSLENFGEDYDECYLAYRNFLRAERKSQSNPYYEDIALLYAERSAELLLAQYAAYKENKEVRVYNHGKQLILSAESGLSETYDGIVANLNGALGAFGYPSITNQDIEIGFGGNISSEIVYDHINVDINVGNLQYSFFITFNKNGEFSEDFINYFKGTSRTGYEPGDPDLLNPRNEEYAELFERIKIENIDLNDINDPYAGEWSGHVLYNPCGEETYLYF